MIQNYHLTKIKNIKDFQKIDTKQTEWVKQWHIHIPSKVTLDFWGILEQQHLQNFNLWHEEDKARSPKASDSQIATVKKAIDTLNQKRNDLIEKLDEFFIQWFISNKIELSETAKLCSETPGSMIDRCSIMALKIYHMEEQTHRNDVDSKHIEQAIEKVNILKIQRDDLLNCLYQLLHEVTLGTSKFKIYRQFKMYNDPSLNPSIYNSLKTSIA